jgi:hypothetical protein
MSTENQGRIRRALGKRGRLNFYLLASCSLPDDFCFALAIFFEYDIVPDGLYFDLDLPGRTFIGPRRGICANDKVFVFCLECCCLLGALRKLDLGGLCLSLLVVGAGCYSAFALSLRDQVFGDRRQRRVRGRGRDPLGHIIGSQGDGVFVGSVVCSQRGCGVGAVVVARYGAIYMHTGARDRPTLSVKVKVKARAG